MKDSTQAAPPIPRVDLGKWRVALFCRCHRQVKAISAAMPFMEACRLHNSLLVAGELTVMEPEGRTIRGYWKRAEELGLTRIHWVDSETMAKALATPSPPGDWQPSAELSHPAPAVTKPGQSTIFRRLLRWLLGVR